MSKSWLWMQLQKRIDGIHNLIGNEKYIKFHDCRVTSFFSFLFFSLFSSLFCLSFCFHVLRLMLQGSHLEKDKALHYLWVTDC